LFQRRDIVTSRCFELRLTPLAQVAMHSHADARTFELEVNPKHEVCVGETVKIEYLDSAHVLHFVIDMKMGVVKERFEQSRIVSNILLHPRQRIAPERQQLAFSLERFLNQLQPCATRQLLPERRRVQK